jgi:hypothetical protein
VSNSGDKDTGPRGAEGFSFAMPPTALDRHGPAGPRDDGAVCRCEKALPTPRIVIARRRSRRGNPGGYRSARPGRPPTLDRHGPAGPRDDGSVCHCEEAKPTRQSRGFAFAPDHAAPLPWIAMGLPALAMTAPFVIARRHSRRGNPGVYRRARPDRPPALDRHGPAGPRDDGSICHCEEA